MDLITYVVAVASAFDKIIYLMSFLWNICVRFLFIASDGFAEAVRNYYRSFFVYRLYYKFSRGIMNQAGKTFLQIVLKKHILMLI